jgi:hypothetical protein
MSAAAHVVERCPTCGVEHDLSDAAECEACHTPLRPWCRRHSRDTGWLDGPACPRCADEATPPPTSSPPRRVAVSDRPVLRGLGPPREGAAPARKPVEHVPGRPLSEILEDSSSPHRESEGQQLAGAGLLVLLGVGGGGLLGVVAGLVHAVGTGESVTGAPLTWGLAGVVVGLVGTLLLALAGIARSSSR